MIARGQLSPIGRVNKTHGVRGELTLHVQPEFAAAIVDGDIDCLVLCVDGIFVPFFIATSRERSAESVLVTIDGIDTQEQAAAYVGHDVYALLSQAEPVLEARQAHDGHDGDEGTTADQLIGYKAVELIDADTERLLGTIVDIDDSTANVLFVIEPDEGGAKILVPIADEFIGGFDPETATIYFNLPPGLIEEQF